MFCWINKLIFDLLRERVNCHQMLISGWNIPLTAIFRVSAEVWLQRRVEFQPYLMILLHAVQSGGTAAGVGGVLLCCLHDGAAVLHGSGLDRFLMLRHHCAGLVWMVTVCETGISDPWRPTGWTGIRWRISWQKKQRTMKLNTHIFSALLHYRPTETYYKCVHLWAAIKTSAIVV